MTATKPRPPRCMCGKRYFPWHNPARRVHPLPSDGSPSPCCGVCAWQKGNLA